MNDVLQLENICLGFSADRPVIQNLSLILRSGDYKVIPTGTGSEEPLLLKMVVGELKPLSGSGLLLGYPMLKMSSRRRRQLLRQIGVITKVDPAPNISLSQFVALPLRIAGVRSSQIDQQVRALLKELGMTLLAVRPVNSLAADQLRLAAVAQALIKSPRLILLESRSQQFDNEVIRPLLRRYSLHGGAVLELAEERTSTELAETLTTSHEEVYVPA